MDSDKSSEATSDDFEVVDKQEKTSPGPNLLISVNGDAELEASLDSAIKETDSLVASPNLTSEPFFLDGAMTLSQIESQDETGVVYNKVVYLGAANLNNPRSEGEIQKTIAVMRQQAVGGVSIPVSLSVPNSSEGAVVLYDAATQVELARYAICRILYFARGVASSPECSCFAFTCARGESHDSALFQSHVFRCDIPEAVGRVFASFGNAFRKQKQLQSPDRRIPVFIPDFPPSEVVFEVSLEIREADPKGNYSAVPKDKNFFKVRSNIEKQVVITVQQISEGLLLNVERCFGLLISSGKAVKKSDMHLLEMVSMGTSTVDKRSVYTITGLWDPGDPAFSQLNKETPKEVDKAFMTVAVDLVVSGIREPVRLDIETTIRVFPQYEKFWYIVRKHHVEQFTLSLKEVVDTEDRYFDVVSVETSGEIEKPQRSIGLTLNLGSLSLNSSTLSSLPSISPLTTETPKDEEMSDNDEPLLSGSGDVSKECSESELESWAQALEVWKENENVRPKQLQTLIKGGVPEALRGEIWLRLVGCFDQSELMDSYRILITKECAAEEVILRDLHRTFPAHDYFKENGGHGQDSLAKIVRAYSIYDEEIGYCQGITFIAAALLLHMPEEQAFCVLVKIMADYGLRDLFKDGLEVLHLRFYQLDKLLEEQMPDLFNHFIAQGVESHMFASQWFLTLFTAKFPLYLVFRILDLYLYAKMDAVFQIALALLSVSKRDLLQLSFENVLKYFRVQLPKRFRSEEAARHLMRVASSMKVKKLAKHEVDYYEYKALSEDPITRLEREKRRLQKTSLRLEHENDSLAHELINVKLKLRSELDEAERKLDVCSRELQATRRSLKDVEEDRKRLDSESLQVKEILKKELIKNEAESQRSAIIITEYKKICTDLSQQLEDDRKLIEEVEKSNQEVRCEACLAKRRETHPLTAGSSSELAVIQLHKHVRELELELAQTKLALVESQCKNQDLTHQATSLSAELQASKSGWFQKTISSIKEAAKTNINQPILNQPRASFPPSRKDSMKEAQC